MKKFKALSVLALFILSVLAVAIPVHADAVPVNILNVKVNGDSIMDTTQQGPKRVFLDDMLDIEVKLQALEDQEHLVVSAELTGLDHDAEKARDYTDSFSLDNGDKYTADLAIEAPKRIEEGVYMLRVEVGNKKDSEVVFEGFLNIKPTRNRVDIKDVIFSPANEVKAGYTLITNVKVKNYGERDEDDVKVSVAIPELGAAAQDSVYISNLDAGDSKTSEDLWFRIPKDTQDGNYNVEVTVEYDDGDEETTETYSIAVVDGKEASENSDAGKTIIAVSQEAQNIVAGGDAVVYPITISNSGDASKTYTIAANVGDWANVAVNPNMLVLNPEETKIVFVSVAANEDATAGSQVFGVTVSTGDKSEEITMNANVLAAKESKSLKNGLEIALIVLVVILIIIALVIGFSRMRKSDDDEEEQTYY